MNNENNNLNNQMSNNVQNPNQENPMGFQFQPNLNNQMPNDNLGQVNSVQPEASANIIPQNGNQNINNTIFPPQPQNPVAPTPSQNPVIQPQVQVQPQNTMFQPQAEPQVQTQATIQPPVQPEAQINQPLNGGIGQQPQTNFQPNLQNNPAPAPVNVNTNNNSNKNKSIVFIILGIIAFVVVVAVVIIFVLGKNNKNVNEYETTQINESTSVSNIENTNVYSYNGFDFEKISGYTYDLEGTNMIVYNDMFATIFEIGNKDYSEIKSNYKEYSKSLKDLGYIVNKESIDTSSGKEFIVYETTVEGKSMIFYITQLGSTNYVVIGSTFNIEYKIDYSNLKTTAAILNNAKKQAEGVSTYSDTFSFNNNSIDLFDFAK